MTNNDKQDQLTIMFEKRQKMIDEASVEIFEFLKIPLEAVVDFFIRCNEHYEGSVIEWRRVFFEPTEDMVYVVGYQTHKIGTIVPAGGKTKHKVAVEITQETAPYFNRTIDVGLPFPLAITDNKQEVIDYLTNTENEYAEKLAKIVNAMTTSFQRGELEEDVGFDLSSLTEEQRKVMVSPKKKGRKLN